MPRLALCLIAAAAVAPTTFAYFGGYGPSPYAGKRTRKGLRARGGGIPREVPSEEVEALAGEAFDWLANLGAPAALVAGAVLQTLSDEKDALRTYRSDRHWVKIAKRAAHLLLISSFALNILSIFSTTVTGTMLKSLGDRNVVEAAAETISPLGHVPASCRRRVAETSSQVYEEQLRV